MWGKSYHPSASHLTLRRNKVLKMAYPGLAQSDSLSLSEITHYNLSLTLLCSTHYMYISCFLNFRKQTNSILPKSLSFSNRWGTRVALWMCLSFVSRR